jgi:hypothetical protein
VASGFSGHGFGMVPAPVDSSRTWCGRGRSRRGAVVPVAAILRRLADPPGTCNLEEWSTVNPTEQGVQASEFQPALAARFYASESVFALERERLFHAQWFCVGRAEQVPTRGECLTCTSRARAC